MRVPTNDFLEHYGVKGMHWGKHKSSSAVEVARKPSTNKDKLKAARKDLYSGATAHYKTKAGKVELGASIASSLIGGSVGSSLVGARMMRSAGYSKGKSVAMALTLGAPGAALAIELKARKMAKE